MLAATERLTPIIATLRAEADDVKKCFTDHSMQAIKGSATLIAIMFASIQTVPHAALAGIPIAYWLIAVARVGLYKYGTANRNHGYELHLERTAKLPKRLAPRASAPAAPSAADLLAWKPWMRYVGWEEAVRAWRVVQARAFKEVYVTPKGESVWTSVSKRLFKVTRRAQAVRDAFRKKPRTAATATHEYPWCFLIDLTTVTDLSDPKKQVVAYSGGSYLRTMFRKLEFLQIIAVAPLGYAALHFALASELVVPPILQAVIPSWVWGVICGAFYGCACVVMLWIIRRRHLRVRRRREMLENELVSIHSCSIIWQAVVLAHFRAIHATNGTFEHYTQCLVNEAESLSKHLFSIHRWIRGEVH